MPRPSAPETRRTARVVACISHPDDLRLAARLKPGAVDLIEFRADLMPGPSPAKAKSLEKLGIPLILTARHPREGGAQHLGAPARVEELNYYLHLAHFVDLELLHLVETAEIQARARREGHPLIISLHDFARTPSLRQLRHMARRAAREGASMFKAATRTDTLPDLLLLVRFLLGRRELPLIAMGMGRFGRVSRLLLAQAGSALNYGFLRHPTAPGQWPAIELKALLAEAVRLSASGFSSAPPAPAAARGRPRRSADPC